MKLSVFLTALITATSAWASPAGTYYVPFQDYGDGTYQPEQLMEIRDSVSTFHAVHNGKREIVESTTVTTATSITIVSERYLALCPGVSSTNSEVGLTMNYSRKGKNLVLSMDGGQMTLKAATPEQINNVLSRPACP